MSRFSAKLEKKNKLLYEKLVSDVFFWVFRFFASLGMTVIFGMTQVEYCHSEE